MLSGVALLAPPGVAHAREADACVAAAESSQTLVRAGHLREAREKLLLCARDACPAVVQTDCKHWLADVEHSTPTVVVRAVDEHGADMVDVRVLVDGALLAERLDGRAIAVDPGEHVLRFEQGARSVERRVLVREAERDRLLTVDFPAPKSAAAASAPEEPPPPPSHVPTGVWILGGVGAVAMGTGVYLWVRGRSDRDNLYATCGTTHSCATSDVDAARTKVLVGDVVFGAGIVAVGAAVGWALLTPSSSSGSPSSPTASHRVQVGAAPAPGGAWATVAGTF